MNMKRSALATAAALSLGFAGSASAELTFEADNGWEFGVGGYIPVFATVQSVDDGNDEFEVGTGFNPASLNFRVAAPTTNGLNVSGLFQINNHLGVGGNSVGSNDGNTDSLASDGFGSRIARISVAGDFGTVHIGKTFGLFGTPAIGDSGSAMGIGNRGLNQVTASGGRIGTGYFYADFEPQVQYVSNRMSGLGFAAAIIQPDSPNDFQRKTRTLTNGTEVDEVISSGNGETDTPRLEAKIDWKNDRFHVWTSGGIQEISDVTDQNGNAEDATLSGIDFGGQVNFGPASLRANYAMTEGTGGAVWGGTGAANTIDERDHDQWYVEGTVDPSANTKVGASYGEGGFEDAADTELVMLFGRYNATDALTFMAEITDSDTEDGGQEDTLFSLGAQLNF